MVEQQDIDNFKEYIALEMENALIDVCPVDMGTLRQSISVEVKGDELVVHMLEYGVYLDQGTGLFGPKGIPYLIQPKNKKALAGWKHNGGDVVVKQVVHPGIHSNPWIRNTFFHKLPGIVNDAAQMFLPMADVEVSYS